MSDQKISVDVTENILFATHLGSTLHADLYRPNSAQQCPVVISMHGGGWDSGSRGSHREWGHYLAGNGFALFAIDRRHFGHDTPAFPGAINDLRAAIGYVRREAEALRIDPRRLCLLGDSSGGYVAALTGLLGNARIPRAHGEPDLADSTDYTVKAVISVYGVFDLMAEWAFEQTTRPFDRSVEKLFGKPMIDDRILYFESSPIAYATRDRSSLPFLLSWGTQDSVVDENLHSKPFLKALSQANFPVTSVEIPSAQHYWFCDPIDEDRSHSGFLAPRILRFLHEHLA